MFYTIYEVKYVNSGKTYIGKHQTEDLDDGYMGSGVHITRSIRKHGVENFVKKILHVFDNEDEMNAKEAELVTEEYCLREDTYNICVGGQGGFSHINRNSDIRNGFEDTMRQPEVRKAALDAAKRGKETQLRLLKEDTEYKEKFSKSMSEAMKGKQQFLGKTHSEETKRKIGEINSKIQSGKGNSQYGSMWITNGLENKKIKKVDSIPEGWYKGRKMK